MKTFNLSPTGKLSKSLLGFAFAASSAILTMGAASAQETPAADTLAAIKDRGHLVCGVAGDRPGFAFPDSKGVMQGLDADVCRSVAAAIFGDASKVRFTSLTSLTRFPALQSGEIDMLARFTTWTLTREATQGLQVASTYFYDGQGFLVKKELGVSSVLELDGASVCVQPGSTGEVNMVDYFRANDMELKPVVIEKIDQLRDSLVNNRCDAYTNDASQLGSLMVSMGDAGNDYEILPEVISKEPLGVFVRKGDQKFFDIVRWTHAALLTAEELGITQSNVDEFTGNDDPQVQRFMGENGDLGVALGLDNAWAANAVKAVGNYGEMFERNIVPLGIKRGPNHLFKDGGLQYAPPMR